jgi:hypothetical protein
VTGWGQIARGRHAGRAGEIVARSALGAVGARASARPRWSSAKSCASACPRGPSVNVDGSRVVRASEWLLGAHRDIDHPEIATLIGMAAGLAACRRAVRCRVPFHHPEREDPLSPTLTVPGIRPEPRHP